MKNRNKYLIIASVSLIAFALIMFFIGGALSGWRFDEIFTSTPAQLTYVSLGVAVLVIAYYFSKRLL